MVVDAPSGGLRSRQEARRDDAGSLCKRSASLPPRRRLLVCNGSRGSRQGIVRDVRPRFGGARQTSSQREHDETRRRAARLAQRTRSSGAEHHWQRLFVREPGARQLSSGVFICFRIAQESIPRFRPEFFKFATQVRVNSYLASLSSRRQHRPRVREVSVTHSRSTPIRMWPGAAFFVTSYAQSPPQSPIKPQPAQWSSRCARDGSVSDDAVTGNASSAVCPRASRR